MLLAKATIYTAFYSSLFSFWRSAFPFGAKLLPYNVSSSLHDIYVTQRDTTPDLFSLRHGLCKAPKYFKDTGDPQELTMEHLAEQLDATEGRILRTREVFEVFRHAIRQFKKLDTINMFCGNPGDNECWDIGRLEELHGVRQFEVLYCAHFDDPMYSSSKFNFAYRILHNKKQSID
jgi:hypothetical protein